MTVNNQTATKPKKTKSAVIIPANAIELTGQHLIEASAGTGKTWTLTGIVLRLLIEGKRPPEQIICTTFTRDASTEMRERIMSRLNEFYQLLLWVEKLSHQASFHDWLYDLSGENLPDEMSDVEFKKLTKAQQENYKKQQREQETAYAQRQQLFREKREQQLLPFAKRSGYDSCEDPVNVHLIHYLLDNFIDYPLTMAIRRTQLLLVSMDKLFVGTLDSLAQKWLSEFSTETGFQKGMTISSHDDELITDIIHDELRKFHARTDYHNPQLYQLLQQTGKLTQVSDHKNSVDKAMNFYSAHINDVEGFDFVAYKAIIEEVAQHNISDVTPYFDDVYKKKKGLNGRTGFYKKLASIKNIFECVGRYEVLYALYLEDDSADFLIQLTKVVEDKENKSFGFNNNREAERAEFLGLTTIKLLCSLQTTTNQLDNELIKLNHDIIHAVRTRLPIQLEERNETTFSLQMVRLNQALTGEQGQKLAQYIRHHYPIALIDESQDINGEQASMIRSVYMDDTIGMGMGLVNNPTASAQITNINANSNTNTKTGTKKHKYSFLLLVGDPKQAIYGFRGGDVANYNAMKDSMSAKGVESMNLTVNRRSHAGIINSLNQWFGVLEAGNQTGNEQNNEINNEINNSNKFSQLGEGIDYKYINAFREQSQLSWLSGRLNRDEPSTTVNVLGDINDNINDNGTEDKMAKDITGEQAVAVIHVPYRHPADANKPTNKTKKSKAVKPPIDTKIVNVIEATPIENVKTEAEIKLAEQQKEQFAKQEINDLHSTIAQHIHYLLTSNTTLKGMAGRKVQASDIAVLSRARKDLQQVQYRLQKLGIATVRTADVNVFSTLMADDLLAMMHAIQQPYHAGVVNRALTSACYGLSLQQVKALEKTGGMDENKHSANTKKMTFGYYDFQERLQAAKKCWLEYGVMSAIQLMLSDNPFVSLTDRQSNKKNHSKSNSKSRNKASVWEQIARHSKGERFLLDLRQLLELLATFGRNKSSTEILDWFTKQKTQKNREENTQQPLPTESGVQLMTVHKSKGLEFPIVYIIGMDDKASRTVNNLDVYPYIYRYEGRHKNLKETLNLTGNLNLNAETDTTNNNLFNESDVNKNQQTAPLMAKTERRLSLVKSDERHNFYDMATNDNLDESKRLAYVALTRASEQVYVVVKDHSSKTALQYRPANLWLECNDASYALPNRLDAHVSWINSQDIWNATSDSNVNPNNKYAKKEHQNGEDIALSSQSSALSESKRIEYPNYRDVVRKTQFVGWSKTSFTALSRQLDKKSEEVAINEADYVSDDEDFSTLSGMNGFSVNLTQMPEGYNQKNQTSQTNQSISMSNNDIRFTFVRGAGAGTFLHQVLERVDFNDSHSWSEEIDRGLREYALPTSYASPQLLDRLRQTEQTGSTTTAEENEQVTAVTPHDQLKVWLADILSTPMLASKQSLASVPVAQRKPELAFDLGLSESFRAEQINAVFAKHLDIKVTNEGVTGKDSDKLLTLSAKTTTHYYRFLRGEIDLVYEYQGKYYIVDYKSNYLGADISDYGTAQMNQAMSKAGYWLQAVIYQVALHRLLKLRLPNYIGNEAEYLGAAEYVFLRGCLGESQGSKLQGSEVVGDTTDHGCGRVIWDIPIGLVKDMDALFDGKLLLCNA